jgi:hypothetical protein
MPTFTQCKTGNQEYIGDFRARDSPGLANLQGVPNRQNELLHCSDRMAIERKTEKMPTSQKDQMAAEAIDRREDFQQGLASVKRKYPIGQFQAFWSATNAMPN